MVGFSETHLVRSSLVDFSMGKIVTVCSRQDKTVILGKIFTYFPLIFRRFSAYGTPSAVFPPTCLWIAPSSAYFRLFFAYFLPIFRLWYPILIINSSMLPICRFSAHMFTDSAYFRLFSAYFPPIFRLSCLAGTCNKERTIFAHLYCLYCLYCCKSFQKNEFF